MHALRLVAVVVGLTIAAQGAALAQSATQGSHWLVGNWTGERNVGQATRSGSERVLTVRSVTADDAAASGTWRTERANVPVKISIRGDHVVFSSGTRGLEGSDYSLDRRGDTLVGTYTGGSGKPGAITLTRQK